MLEIHLIRSNFEAAVSGLQKRGIPQAEPLLQKVLDTDQQRRDLQLKLDKTLEEGNIKSKQIGMLMQEGRKDEAQSLKTETSTLKLQSKGLQDELQDLISKLKSQLYDIPNIPHIQVPAGTEETDNQVTEEWGTKPQLTDNANSPHWDLIKKYDIIDFDLGSKITGAGFPIYKGAGAKLQRALISFFLDEAEQAGYHEIQPPIVINEDSGLATGQLPDKEGQMYGIVDSNFYLIPTAEVPITNIYRDSMLRAQDLPVKMVGYTPCFRREAGSWGADVRGLNRLHQFDKVEIVQIQTPENSYVALQEMCDHVKALLQKLELPYRILNLCGGDLGFTSAQTFDFEVFAGAQQKWLEVSSVSNFETYQSNRLKLRYKKDGKSVLLHTLNGSALALPRIVAALLENNQTPKGIKLPPVLVPYTGFEQITNK
ncbi:MAG: serine--tRNA ligase [Cyclobacteriaceae bacterium]|nr:serine--tRNA ligase [Cyclobacteriaceae bacterium]